MFIIAGNVEFPLASTVGAILPFLYPGMSKTVRGIKTNIGVLGRLWTNSYS